MSINTTKICDDLEIADEGTTVIAYNKNNEKVIVPYGVLEWRNEYDDGDDWDLPLFLKLSEISSQLIAKGYKPTFFVWWDMGLSGKIYAYTNEEDNPHWKEYGETIGYP